MRKKQFAQGSSTLQQLETSSLFFLHVGVVLFHPVRYSGRLSALQHSAYRSAFRSVHFVRIPPLDLGATAFEEARIESA